MRVEGNALRPVRADNAPQADPVGARHHGHRARHGQAQHLAAWRATSRCHFNARHRSAADHRLQAREFCRIAMTGPGTGDRAVILDANQKQATFSVGETDHRLDQIAIVQAAGAARP